MPTERYSPRLLEKIEYAGGNEVSFAVASRALERLAELPISAKHVQGITERLGRERVEKRDQEVAAFQAGTLQPTHAEPPQVAVISVGEGNRFGLPSREVLERLEGTLVYRTDENGTVTVTSDGHRLWIETER